MTEKFKINEFVHIRTTGGRVRPTRLVEATVFDFQVGIVKDNCASDRLQWNYRALIISDELGVRVDVANDIFHGHS